MLTTAGTVNTFFILISNPGKIFESVQHDADQDEHKVRKGRFHVIVTLDIAM